MTFHDHNSIISMTCHNIILNTAYLMNHGIKESAIAFKVSHSKHYSFLSIISPSTLDIRNGNQPILISLCEHCWLKKYIFLLQEARSQGFAY